MPTQQKAMLQLQQLLPAPARHGMAVRILFAESAVCGPCHCCCASPAMSSLRRRRGEVAGKIGHEATSPASNSLLFQLSPSGPAGLGRGAPFAAPQHQEVPGIYASSSIGNSSGNASNGAYHAVSQPNAAYYSPPLYGQQRHSPNGSPNRAVSPRTGGHPSAESGGVLPGNNDLSIKTASPDERLNRKLSNTQYLQELQEQMAEKSRLRAEDRSTRHREEQRRLQQAAEYNPWGRPGAGAPMRDIDGNIISSRKPDPSTVQAYSSPSGSTFLSGPGSSPPFPSQQPVYGQNFSPGAGYGHRAQSVGHPSGTAISWAHDAADAAAAAESSRSTGGTGGHRSGAGDAYPGPNIYYSPNDPAAGNGAATSPSFGRFKVANAEPWVQEERFRKTREKQQLQDALRLQVEERQRQKAAERARFEEEDRRTETKLQREREELASRFRQEQTARGHRGGGARAAVDSPGRHPQQQQQQQQQQQNYPSTDGLGEYELERMRRKTAALGMSPDASSAAAAAVGMPGNEALLPRNPAAVAGMGGGSSASSFMKSQSLAGGPLLSPNPSLSMTAFGPNDEALFLQTRLQIESLRDEFRKEKTDLLKLMEKQYDIYARNSHENQQPGGRGGYGFINQQQAALDAMNSIRKEMEAREQRTKSEIDRLRFEVQHRMTHPPSGGGGSGTRGYGGFSRSAVDPQPVAMEGALQPRDALDQFSEDRQQLQPPQASYPYGPDDGTDAGRWSRLSNLDHMQELNENRMLHLNHISSQMGHGAEPDALDAVLRGFASPAAGRYR